ncbi:hypothetical protein GA0074696_1372 [Micromonospora purpureochromogenes]|uniref:Uncharacterized protein n=1 Tax=Micromonospora purpureochromogenes TaxID=47872 RepID=A0A1C4VTY4_9ACTN|nr:hypothetical protein GA0074696_1372 [Micromonospora purpureochromogenes]
MAAGTRGTRRAADSRTAGRAAGSRPGASRRAAYPVRPGRRARCPARRRVRRRAWRVRRAARRGASRAGVRLAGPSAGRPRPSRRSRRALTRPEMWPGRRGEPAASRGWSTGPPTGPAPSRAAARPADPAASRWTARGPVGRSGRPGRSRPSGSTARPGRRATARRPAVRAAMARARTVRTWLLRKRARGTGRTGRPRDVLDPPRDCRTGGGPATPSAPVAWAERRAGLSAGRPLPADRSNSVIVYPTSAHA